MSRALVVLNSKHERERVANWAMKLPAGTRVEFKEAKRTTDQNARLWAALTDIARQVQYHGLRLTPDDYKLIFLDALKREVRMVPNLDGNGFVSLGRSSSDLSKDEFSMLLEVVYAFGAQHGVKFGDEKQEVAA